MEQIYFGERLAAYRKQQHLTQEQLAQKLGVTNQAVSKWESDQCCPDIMLLPALADVYGISIDALFGRTQQAEPQPHQDARAVINTLPWPDDDDLRAVCYVGHRLMDYTELSEKRVSIANLINVRVGGRDHAELRFSGSVRDIHAACGVVVESGTIGGSVYAEDGVTCGNVGGSVTAGEGVNCGDVGGSVTAGDGVNCRDINGNVRAGDSVRCGDVSGSVNAGDSVHCGSVGGDVTAVDGVVIANNR